MKTIISNNIESNNGVNNSRKQIKVGDRVERKSDGERGTVDSYGVTDGKLTYIVKYDRTQRRESDGFEYLTEEVFENEIEPAPFFTAGVKYRCIKSVVMKKGGKTAFKAGSIYEQVGEPSHWVGWLRNEQGERHGWPQPVYIEHECQTWDTKPEDIDPRLYFEPVAA